MTVLPQNVLEVCAAGYAQRGWPVFPCEPRGKRPYGLFAPHGFKDATLDLDVITGWWEEQSDCNIAAACTPASGLLVLDVDGPAGLEALEQLRLEHGALPETLVARTGRELEGWHYYWRHPGGELKGRLGTGLDVKHLGYVVVPPSVHPSGNRYRWRNWGTEPAELPQWLLKLLRKPERRSGPARATKRLTPKRLSGLVRVVATAPVGERNPRLFWVGCRLAEAGAGMNTEAVHKVAQAAQRNGLDHSEVWDVLYRALSSKERT